MAVTLTGTGGLFTRIGKSGKVAHDMRTYQGTTLPTNITNLLAQYQSTLQGVVGSVPDADITNRQSVSGIMDTLKTVAESTLTEMVKDDIPASSDDTESSMAELIAQMVASADSVKACTVSVTPTAQAGNYGTGFLVSTTKRGDGKTQELIIPETGYLLCTADAQTGGASQGRETFVYTGAPAVADVWSEEYPSGSGAAATINAVDATTDATTNLLTNSDFEDFVANAPTKWTIHAGSAGTDILKSTTQFYSGLASLQLVGGGTAPSLSQKLNDSDIGTAGEVKPRTSYAVNFVIKADVVPAAGVLTVELIGGASEGSLAVLTDDEGVNNSFTVTLSTISTSWAQKSGVFRLPRVLPAIVRLRLRVSTGISGGSNIFIDHLAMAEVTQLYAGGPGVAIFSGATPFILADGWILANANNYGGASNLSTFQWLFERMFGMAAMGLLLPVNASPTIADSLISS